MKIVSSKVIVSVRGGSSGEAAGSGQGAPGEVVGCGEDLRRGEIGWRVYLSSH